MVIKRFYKKINAESALFTCPSLIFTNTFILGKDWNGYCSCAFSWHVWSWKKSSFMFFVFVASQTVSSPVKTLVWNALWLNSVLNINFRMLFDFVLSQSSSRTGDLSADIARVGNVAGDVINFNVLLNCRSLIFFSTNIAWINFYYSRSHILIIIGPCHHGLDLFV